MKKIIVSLIISLSLFFAIRNVSAGEEKFDKYGGWAGVKGFKTGVFHTEKINNRWWIITPEGNAFWSIGMYCVRIGGIPETGTDKRVYRDACFKKYGNEHGWANATRMQLYKWGFNTIGDWSSESIYREPGLTYVIGINLSNKAENVIPKGNYGYFPDVFSQDFKDGCKEKMESVFKNQPYLIDDPWLLGYFLADEPAWYGSKVRRGSLTDDFIALDDSRPGKKAWLEFIKAKYGESGQATEQDKLEFLRVIAEQFSKILHDTLREYDKYHMILGSRPTRFYPEVVAGIGKYCDIFAISAYGLNQGYVIDQKFDETIGEIYKYVQKPIMLGVLIAAQDTGLPYGVVRTQRDRGVSYWRYMAKVAAYPEIVGMHWFQYFDPPRKCYDAKAANWGLVNDQDEPYTEAVQLITQANKMVYAYALGLTDFTPEFDGLLTPKKEKVSNIGEAIQKAVSIPIPNGDFEDGQQKWALQAWKGKSRASIDSSVRHSGKFSVKIQGGPDEGWGSVGVAVQSPNFTLKPEYKYKFSAWIKTKDVGNSAFVRIKVKYEGGDDGYFGTDGLYGTGDWKQVEVVFSPREGNTVQYLDAQLVGKGTAWFDDIKLELIE
ncbi:MAG: carbohydrate binding domain-containing protein [Candidatus Omnitrophota bacterium]